jgi:hypothetical protein
MGSFAASSALAAAARSGEMNTGTRQRRAISTGSSPKCSGVARSGNTRTTPDGSCPVDGTRP